MRCANSACGYDAQDLQDGTLRLLEVEVSPEERVMRSDGGFPVCAVLSKYFWLCAECSRIFNIRRWTHAGLVLEPIAQEKGQLPRVQIMQVQLGMEKRPPGTHIASYDRVA